MAVIQPQSKLLRIIRSSSNNDVKDTEPLTKILIKPKMAASKLDETPLLPGSIHPATVEMYLNNVIVVCLRHETKIYKGVLMDTSNR